MHAVARLSELAEGRITKARLGETDIVLIRDGATIRAFGGTCPHAGAPLHEGALCGGRLVCPWHKAMFRVSDGELLEPPALDSLTRYDVHVEGDAVMVAANPIAPSPPPTRRASDQTFAIIGSGAGGATAAVELRRAGFGGRVVLIGNEAQEPYDRTALSKFALSGEMALAEVPPLRDADYWSGQDIERIDATVSYMDAAAKRVRLADGTVIAYDSALLAPGGVAQRPDVPGAALAGVCTLRNKHDVAAIAAAATEGVRVVIVGSSFIGLEAASALRTRGVQVTVAAPEQVPFAKQFGEEIGAMLRRLHEANGVAFRLGTDIDAIEGTDRARAVALRTGETLPADCVILAVGVKPATDFVAGVEKAPDGGIAVDASMRAGDGLYVAGDCAAFPYRGSRVRIEHWRVAQQHARVAAHAMMGRAATYEGVPFFWTYHFGKRIGYVGHAADWDTIHIAGDLDAQRFVALQVKTGLVEGVVACQRERTAAILIDRMREPLPLAEAQDIVARG